MGVWEPQGTPQCLARERGKDGTPGREIMGWEDLTFSPLGPASPFSPGRPEGPWQESKGPSASLTGEISQLACVC